MDAVWFFGRWHVLALHLPIGIVLVTIALECCAWSPRLRYLQRAAPLLWSLAALTGVLTMALGLAHATEGGFDVAQLAAHRKWAIALTVAVCATWLLRVMARHVYRRMQPVIALVVLVLLFGTGHFGGNLTHGATYLLEYVPGGLGSRPIDSSMAGGPAAGNAQLAASPLVAEMLRAGFLVRLVALDDTRLVVGTTAPGRAVTAEQLATLRRAALLAVEIDFSEAGLDDGDLEILSEFSALETLRLANNDISDAGVQRLAKLGALRELNLYGNTNVTDASVDVFLEMDALEEVFLWQTSVTEAALAQLRAARPGLRVQAATGSDFLTAPNKRTIR